MYKYNDLKAYALHAPPNTHATCTFRELIVADTEYRRTLRKKAAALAEADVDSRHF